MKKSKTKKKYPAALAKNGVETNPFCGLPTPSEIAMIAATLSPNESESPVPPQPEILADQAMKLWLAARARIFDTAEWNELGRQGLNLDDYTIKKYVPALDNSAGPTETRDQFLIRMLPQCRPGDRAHLGRVFVRHLLRQKGNGEPTDDHVWGAYGSWNAHNATRAKVLEVQFKSWHKQHLRDIRRYAGLKSAEKRKAQKIILPAPPSR